MRLMKAQQKIVLVGLCLGLFVGGILITWLTVSKITFPVVGFQNTPSPSPQPSPTPSPTPDPLRPRTALLLGYVGGNHEGGLLTDTMLLAQANFKAKQLTLISIPRDLWVTIPLQTSQAATSAGKINQLYVLGTDQRRNLELPEKYRGAEGGLILAQDIVSNVLQQQIEYVLAITQAGLIATLTQLGPIPVKVPYSFVDEYFPITGEENNPCDKTPEDIATLSATLRGFELEKQFTCRYERLEFTAGLQLLDASTGAKFVRSRHAAIGGSDFGRSQRQQALVSGIKNLLSQPTNWLKIPTVMNKVFQNVESTLELTDFVEFVGLTSNPESWTVKSYQLDKTNALWETRSPDGQYILVDRAASGSAQLNDESWPTIRAYVSEWLTQTPAEVASRGGSLDDQAP